MALMQEKNRLEHMLDTEPTWYWMPGLVQAVLQAATNLTSPPPPFFEQYYKEFELVIFF